MNRNEIEALINTYLYKYYQEYVEPLEREFDALNDENEKLKEEINKLKKAKSNLRKKLAQKRVEYSEEEINRIRSTAQKVIEDNKRLRALNERLMNG